jgi:hypothetical protein
VSNSGHFDNINQYSPTWTGTVDLLYRWFDLGVVTTATGSLAVTISNQGGSGTLVAEAVRLERVCPRAINTGDAVVLNALDSWINTAVGTTGPAINVSVPLLTDAGFAPFDPTAARTSLVDYTLGAIPDSDCYANRAKNANFWGGGGTTTDSHGFLNSIGPAPGSFTDSSFLSAGLGNGDDNWGIPGAPISGAWTFVFDTPGNPTVSIHDDAGSGWVSTTSGSQYGPGGVASGPGTGIVYQQTPNYVNMPSYNAAMALGCTSNGSADDYITNVKI